MREIIVGFKPHLVAVSDDLLMDETLDIVYENLEIEDIVSTVIRKLSPQDVSDFYKNNENVDNCVKNYSNKKWMFVLCETNLTFSEINKRKKIIREELSKLVKDKSSNPSNNYIHVSSSFLDAKKEKKVIF